eukprot:3882064-Rhodomonas_salina.2
MLLPAPSGSASTHPDPRAQPKRVLAGHVRAHTWTSHARAIARPGRPLHPLRRCLVIRGSIDAPDPCAAPGSIPTPTACSSQ